jgi:small subunit ribosomal protein S1
MEELLKSSNFESLKEGSVVNATITEVRPQCVVVDIGAKSEATIPSHEFLDMSDVTIGQQVQVYLEKLEDKLGKPVISYEKAQQKKNWEEIQSKCTEGSVIQGRVKAKVKGGLIVNVGLDAFLPASQIDIQQPKNLDQYVGNTYEFKVLKINTERKNIVISRRELIEEQRREKRTKLLAEVQVGDMRRGVVKNITDYGAFIDLDGLDGLLHVTDMSWGRLGHPSEMLKVGEEINVKVLEVDRDRERLSLGLKQTMPNPWEGIERRYPTGAVVTGKVVNMVPYGAFVELEKGVEGLVHITEFSWTKRITKPSEMLKIGDDVKAVVLGIQTQDQKISLSMRQLEPNPWNMVQHNYPVGARVHGVIRNLTNYGAFVELENGIDGMVHVSDMSWTRKINHPGECVKKGDEVDAIVLDVDVENQRISLGMKQLTPDPWQEIDKMFHVGDVVTGKVVKLTNYGAFVEIEGGMDGLVHISQIREEAVEKIKDVIKIGDDVKARVIKIDKENRRVGLSIKAMEYSADALAKEVSAFESVNKNELTNLGDILDEATSKEESK